MLVGADVAALVVVVVGATGVVVGAPNRAGGVTVDALAVAFGLAVAVELAVELGDVLALIVPELLGAALSVGCALGAAEWAESSVEGVVARGAEVGRVVATT